MEIGDCLQQRNIDRHGELEKDGVSDTISLKRSMKQINFKEKFIKKKRISVC
jgi:hypothetical protein